MTTAETVIRNPKESAVIFGCVVILAVLLEFVFAFFRQHRSSYVAGLFVQISEETMIVGCISLLFVFIVQSFPNLPDSWVVIFRWSQNVIFFMIVFFVVGVVWTAIITRILSVMIKKFEFRLLESLCRRQNTEICDMLREEWRIGKKSTVAQDSDGDDEGSVFAALHRLLDRSIDNLGRLREEFGAKKADQLPNGLVPPASSISRLTSILSKRHVEEFLGDAALRMQDYFLQGSKVDVGNESNPNPDAGAKSSLQSALLVLRKVFLHQIRTKKYIPAPIQGLIVASEKTRLLSFILELEASRRDILAAKRTERRGIAPKMQFDSSADRFREPEEVLTFEDLQIERQRKSKELLRRRADRNGGGMESTIGDATSMLDGTISDVTTSRDAKDGAAVIAEKWVAEQSQQWIVDGNLEADVLGRYVPFSKYLYKRMRSTVVSFVDITWQSWIVLVAASSANSARLYALPGHLQSKPVLDAGDYQVEVISFILTIGFIPMIVFVVAFVMLMRNFRWYLLSVKELRLGGGHLDSADASQDHLPNDEDVSVDATRSLASRMQQRALDNTGKKRVGASVWLPPEQLAGQLSGDLYEDPSRYLLRGNKSFSLHMLKIPALLTHYYFAILVVELWGSTIYGAATVGFVVLGLVPVLVVFGLLPIALFAVTCLTSLGLRVDQLLVCFTAARHCRRVAGRQTAHEVSSQDNGEADRAEHDEIIALVAPLVSNTSSTAVDFENEVELDLAQRNLIRRVLGFLPASTKRYDLTNTLFDAVDESTILGAEETQTVMTSTTAKVQSEAGTVGPPPSARSQSFVSARGGVNNSAALFLLRHRVQTLEEALRASGVAVPMAAEVPSSGISPRKSLSRRTSFDATNSSGLSFAAAVGSTVPDSIEQNSEGARMLIEYYKTVIVEQGNSLKQLRDRINTLEATHRGGVLHPSFGDGNRVLSAEAKCIGNESALKGSRRERRQEVSSNASAMLSEPLLQPLPEAVLASRSGVATHTDNSLQSLLPPVGTAPSLAKFPPRGVLNPVHQAVAPPQSSNMQ